MRSLLLLSLLLSTNSWADSQLLYRASENTEVREVNIRIKDGWVRTDFDQKGYTIWNSNQKKFTYVKHKSHEYLSVDEATLTQVAQFAPGLMALLGDDAPQAADVSSQASIPKQLKKTNRQGKAAGIVCDIIEVQENNKTIAEMCMADALQLEMPASELGTLQSLAQFATTLADSFMLSQVGKQPTWLKAFISDQIPLQYWTLQNGKKYLEMELVSVSHPKLNAQVFSPPANYAATDFSYPPQQ